MKACIKNPFGLLVLVAGFGFMLAGPVTAQVFTTLHNFTAGFGGYPSSVTNADGAYPSGGLILSGDVFYGTANGGGNSGNGTVFSVNTDGTGFTTLHSFTATIGPSDYTNSDGATPEAGLILSGNTLYGTTWQGGTFGNGTVFSVNTDGTGFTNLYSFTAGSYRYPVAFSTNSDGAFTVAGLILSGNTLFGAAYSGGSSGNGTLFALNTNKTGFTNLHSFTATDPNTGTNSDGANPYCGMISLGNTLYGTAINGGTFGNGTIFAINTDGTGFTTLHSFEGIDGANPHAGLVLSGNTLYGTALSGIFKVNTDGSGFTTLYNFTELRGPFRTVNTDGANPYAGLVLSGNTLYGTTHIGGSLGNGTVFAVNTDGTGFTNLHNLDDYSDGANPTAGLIFSANTLYGTAVNGGSSGNGTLFSLSFPPQLTIIPSGANLLLTWPTNYLSFDYTGYTLESTTRLTSPTAWKPVSPSPVVIGGQKVVVNPISGTQQFYRLSQ